MEHKYSKAYGRSHSNQKSRQLLDTFDKVSEETHKDGPLLKTKKSLGNIVEDSDGGSDEGREFVATFKHEPKQTNICALFESPVHLESLPKKAKHVAVSYLKTVKKGINKRSNTKPKMKMKSPDSSPTVGTQSLIKDAVALSPISGSPDLPSIEKFRDVKKYFSPRPSFNRELEASHAKSSSSMCDSFIEELVIEDSLQDHGERAHMPFLFTQPRTPTDIRKRSFIKIVTPSCSTEDTLTPCISPVEVENSSSYTSIYTWTTATGTTTSTGTALGTTHLSSAATKMLSAHKFIQGEVSSPSLVLKSYCPDNLHSTAIHPMSDGHMQLTPHVSPIRPLADFDVQHHTPSAPTHKCSPRGPRKTHSFTSKSARGMHPKCSTTLFASPIADAGDAPLDVSSIRVALSEAMDSGRGDISTERNKPRGHHMESLATSIFTSTPCGRGRKKLMWNLSSVKAVVEDEDNLLPLRTSDVVNSQEIVADSFNDSSISMCGDQDAAAVKESEAPNKSDADRMNENNKAESRLHMDTSTIMQYKLTNIISTAEEMEDDAIGDGPHPGSAAGQRREFAHPVSIQKPGTVKQQELRREGSHPDFLDGRGDTGIMAAQGRKDNPIDRQTESGIGEERDQGSADVRGSSVDNQLRQFPVVATQRWHCRVASKRKLPEVDGEERENDVEPCPVSSLVSRNGHEARPKSGKPPLLMWVEPHDSGFLDMLNSTPGK